MRGLDSRSCLVCTVAEPQQGCHPAAQAEKPQMTMHSSRPQCKASCDGGCPLPRIQNPSCSRSIHILSSVVQTDPELMGPVPVRDTGNSEKADSCGIRKNCFRPFFLHAEGQPFVPILGCRKGFSSRALVGTRISPYLGLYFGVLNLRPTMPCNLQRPFWLPIRELRGFRSLDKEINVVRSLYTHTHIYI